MFCRARSGSLYRTNAKGHPTYDTRSATLIGGWLILDFGLILSIGNLPGLNPYMDRMLDLVIWQKDHGSYLTVTEARLVVAVTGGIA